MPRGRPETPRPPAHTPPEPGSVATSGTRGSQDGRVPPPSRSTSPAQAGSTRRPRRQPAPAAPTTGAALTATPGPRFLRPRAHAGLAAPQSIHDPRRLLETLTQPPRPHCEGSTVCCPVCRRRRRLVPAPAAATTTAHLPAPAHQRLLSRTARDSLPRPALVAYAERTPPIGPRAVARAGLGLWNSSRGARRRRPGAERGYYGSFGLSRGGGDLAAAGAGRGRVPPGGTGPRPQEKGSRALRQLVGRGVRSSRV